MLLWVIKTAFSLNKHQMSYWNKLLLSNDSSLNIAVQITQLSQMYTNLNFRSFISTFFKMLFYSSKDLFRSALPVKKVKVSTYIYSWTKYWICRSKQVYLQMWRKHTWAIMMIIRRLKLLQPQWWQLDLRMVCPFLSMTETWRSVVDK